MALPPYEVTTLAELFGPEMANTPAPFFGVNIIDVNSDNMAAFLEIGAVVNEWALKTDGFTPAAHYSIRDYGDRQRILLINYFKKPVVLEEYMEHTPA